MGSSSSRHAGEVSERRDRGDYSATRRESGVGGLNLAGSLSRSASESQTRSASVRETGRGNRLRPGRFSSGRQPVASAPFFDSGRTASTSRGSGLLKASSSGGEAAIASESVIAGQSTTIGISLEGSSSSTPQASQSSGQVADSPRVVDSGRPILGLVVDNDSIEILESVSADLTSAGHSRNNGTQDSHNLWLEGHPPWNPRFGSPLANSAQESSSLIGLSEASRQNLQAACGSALQQHRANEMQERLRRCAGLPPSSLDLHELERRGILSAESSGSQGHRAGARPDNGDASSSVSTRERDERPFRTTPLQTWERMDEGRLIEYRHSVYSESRDRPWALHRSELHSGMSDRVSTLSGPASSSTPISSAGRESRRNGGRRLWDALTRAASHRRTSTPMTPSNTDSVMDSWMLSDDDQIDLGGFHSRSSDLEERRARSQEWALQLLEMPGFTRPCASGGHHHGHCSCVVHGSAAEDTSTRASISRIIMLAEALFEVLDEIHRQSIALSRTSIPTASLPAPDTVVNAIPTRKISKNLRDEATQCNICLVEYEEGDQVRVLPCHHEYHVACVDKWLKEVHRVCPLCRGNVCEAHSPVPLPVST